MMLSSSAAAEEVGPARDEAGPLTPEGDYRPGVCNIGADEIARRRRVGHVGVAASLGLLAALMRMDAPRAARLLVAVPATLAASGYIQARMRFCAGFGFAGVFNFEQVGGTEQVMDQQAREQDRDRARQIGLASLAVGLVSAFLAALLP
jgi:hypothetical protein